MGASFFRFKQFTVTHEQSTMKVGTDGVLLGSWAELENAGQILDVGTGCGIIAIMAAQRSMAMIDAIDIDKHSVDEAGANFSRSPWPERLKAIQAVFNDFAFSTDKKYDVILCNPPFFVHSLLSPRPSRNLARHQHSLSLSDLFEGSKKLLKPGGHLDFIIPADRQAEAENLLNQKQLNIQRKTIVHPIPEKMASRVLIQAGFTVKNFTEEKLIIEDGKRGQYTEQYKQLTADFYLLF